MSVTALFCSYFTLAGNVSPFAANACSPVDFYHRASACAEAGFTGIGLGVDDLSHLFATLGADSVANALRELRLTCELEVLPDWFVDGARRKASDQKRHQLLLAAERLSARHIKVVGDVTGKVWPLEPMVREFQRLCAQAAEVGTAITLELFPTSNLADLQTGAWLVQMANCDNGGLLLDSWHLVRGNISLAAVAQLPAGLVNHVELNDGSLLPVSDYVTDTINHRFSPGAGEFPLQQLLSALRDIDYRGSYGVEILSERFRHLATRQAAQEAYAGLRELLGSVANEPG